MLTSARAFWPKAQMSLRAIGWAIVYLSVAAGTVLLVAMHAWLPTSLAAVPLLKWGLLILWVWLLICSSVFERNGGLDTIGRHAIMMAAAVITGPVLLVWLPLFTVFEAGQQLPIAVGHVAAVTVFALTADRLSLKGRAVVLSPLLLGASLMTAWLLSGEWGLQALVITLALICVSFALARDWEILDPVDGPAGAVVLDGAGRCIWAVSVILCLALLVPDAWR